ncbi:M48 family metalloprotease [Gloeothece verrucosa]|uniref:Peptidase M48 Ste24p n=1 Tax=Gloeothece verrucosa (strain PCC 7822) TaxID=497965 RepID=E0U9W0_GLOV7|nr:M48 family metalloprotease [Gloeothece verrucosa]ADN15030.1 peptidase M48 Ste24p [Gloeothece verrucosa PCC 7822]
MLLQDGLTALREQRYSQAVELLEEFCTQAANANDPTLSQGQMALIKAYYSNGQTDKAIALAEELTHHLDSQVSQWAQEFLKGLTPKNNPQANPKKIAQKAGRAAQTGIKLTMKGFAGGLALASTVTISLLFGMLFVTSLSLIFILESNDPALGLIISITLTIVFSLVSFFLSPVIMDWVQAGLYGTRWVSLTELRHYSKESAEVIERVCQEKNLKQPRLGIIDDQNPTAFTYGSLPNNARLVVSEGLFTYLDDDEAATVYAHELGHIVHWDFAVMTVASTLVQITYLIYVFLNRISRGGGHNKIKSAAGQAALAAYIFYLIGTYLILYLSRTREYYADHFAAETTGNPNGLSRALVKIAYGIVEEGKRTAQPSQLIQGTRALGIADPKAASSTGTAYRIASNPREVGQVFLWDMFNPWGWWMELNSTHPLTGKRIRALTTYAEHLGLETEFDMALVVREGRRLNKTKLYGTFFLDVILLNAPWLGVIIGFILGAILAPPTGMYALLITFPLWGFGIGMIAQTLIMYPNFGQAPQTDILTLMRDPYASPLRGKPVRLECELIGRGDAGYRFGSELKLQDSTGMIFARYASRLGPIGNFLFGWKQVDQLIGLQVKTVGWFHRGLVPCLDLIRLKNSYTTVNSYHRFWRFLLAAMAGVLGLLLLG